MLSKLTARKRRGLKTKVLIKKQGKTRLVVHRTAQHIYAQIVEPAHQGDVVLVAASTLEKDFRTWKGSKSDAAAEVGKLIGDRAKKKKIHVVAFDRAGYKYHGRVKALAEGARAAGLDF